MRRHFGLLSGFATLALAAFVAAPVVGAGASAVPKATGGVALSGPVGTSVVLPQYLSFSAFDYGSPTLDRGTVDYTNFTYPDPGSGVWNLNATTTLVFTYGIDYVHTMNITSIQPTSNDSFTFVGNGFWNSTTWDVTGSVVGTTLTLHIVYTTDPVGYTIDAVGTIQPDGSVVEDSFTDSWGRVLTWSMPAGSAFEVLNYTVHSVSPVSVNESTMTASFSIVAPLGGGVPVTFTVNDGGSPGSVFDTAGWNGTNYTITAGNLVVH